MDENLKLEKSVGKNSNNNFQNPQNQRERMIVKIMNKYNVSFEESEKILSRIEKMSEDNKINQNKVTQNKISDKPGNKSNLGGGVSSKQNVKNEKNSKIDAIHKINDSSRKNLNSKSSERNQINDINNYKKDNTFRQETISNNNEINKNSNNNVKTVNNQDFSINSDKQKTVNRNSDNNAKSFSNNNLSQDKKYSQDVDTILEGILPDYNEQISIKLDHVDLTFEAKNEKIDTLKETFIRTLKRDKSKKIKIHALKDISFHIYKGEKVGIIGYNGAGKSTLLGVITGIYIPDNGNVTTVGKISPLLSLGAGFDHNFSGRTNIMLNGAVLGYDKEFLESKVNEIIEFSELGEYIDIPIKNYSSGMLAKLGFSIATAVDPDILIIDEILGVGDINFQKKSSDKMKSLMDGGTTVILVSHSIPQIRELCDKAIWVDKGHIREIGEVNKVCDAYLKDAEKASNKQLANIQFK